MSGEPDVIHPLRDEAFQLAEDLAAHILDHSNAYHALSGEDAFPGRDRARFLILVTMFEEVGKLMALVRECEKAAKADYVNVRIEDFHDHCLNGRKAVAQILEELRTVELASLTLGRKDVRVSEEPAFVKEDFCSLRDRLLYLDADSKKRDLSFVPDGEQMDRYAEIIERNTLAASEYIHDLGRALGLWLQLGRKARRTEGVLHSVRYL
ncbi:MAG: hypothetical protein SA339_05700 [Methanomassiliicoccus sp.]|nr:hypothetical protein [Methanomassiliicoccus sp.]